MIKSRSHSIAGLAMAALIATSSACSNAGNSDSPPKTAPPEAKNEELGRASRIVITPKGALTDLQGYVVSHPEHNSLGLVPEQDSKPGFLNMASGIYDLILEAKLVGADGKSTPVALRISGVKVAEGADTQIREVELKPYITLKGSAQYPGGADRSGIKVSIPGTKLSALTAADGSYTLADVPEGNHAFEFSRAGFANGYIQANDYKGDGELPSIALIQDSLRLENGVHYLGSALVANAMQKISLQLIAPTSMTHFRYTNADNLNDQAWQVLRSSLEVDLPAGDHPEISVQYSIEQRQLSPVFKAILPIQN